MIDTLIIGGGVAGMTAALYLLRNNRSVKLIEKETIGGQITNSPKVENYPSIKAISGAELSDKIFEQITELGADFDIDEVTKVEKKDNFIVTTKYATYEAKSVIIATGVKHRKLGLTNEDKFLGKGLYYCAICDGPFYKDKNVTVIGDGNSAMQYALMLAGYCKHVDIITLFDKFFGEKSLEEQIRKTPNITITHNASGVQANGDNILRSVTFKRTTDNTTFEHVTDAVFVAIGQVPNNEIFKDLVDLDKTGYIIADEKCLTKTSGLFVAGDCRTKDIRQVITATGDGAICAMNANKYLISLGD